MNGQAVIILSGGLNSKGRLNQLSRERCQAGCRLWRELSRQSKAVLVLSGGRIPGQKHPHSEAELMAQFLQQACPEGQKTLKPSQADKEGPLFVQDQSRNTLEDAYYSKKLSQKHHWQELWLVTSDFHMPRARYAFDKILGSRVTLHNYAAPSAVDEPLRQRLEKRERQLINSPLYRDLGCVIEDGSNDSVERFVQAFLWSPG
jgi:uncharacterized SAM-binding protein YcdF (DUF218 family)